MNEHWVELDGIRFRRVFPWIHLFRGFGIAVDLRKILLAGTAILLLYAGNLAFLSLPFAPVDVDAAGTIEAPWSATFDYGIETDMPLGEPMRFLEAPWPALIRWGTNWSLVLEPVHSLARPAIRLFQPNISWSETAFAWTQLLWGLCVWAVFAGAITRMAAVQFAQGESVSLWRGLRFAVEKFLSYLAAPLLPLLGVGFLWLLSVAGGWIGRIPGAGAPLVGAFWFIALVFGMLMALALAGLAVGWPLMFPAISTEGSDGFDGFSRSFSYVFAKPWHYLWCALVALVYGSAVIFFVWMMASFAVYLAGWSVASGMGANQAEALFRSAPNLVGGTDLLVPAADQSESLASKFVGVWLGIVSVLLVGFVYSYFWTQATIIYFLLRRSDDATDLEVVFLPESEQEDDLLPFVGVADTREDEQPPPGAQDQPAGTDASNSSAGEGEHGADPQSE